MFFFSHLLCQLNSCFFWMGYIPVMLYSSIPPFWLSTPVSIGTCDIFQGRRLWPRAADFSLINFHHWWFKQWPSGLGKKVSRQLSGCWVRLGAMEDGISMNIIREHQSWWKIIAIYSWWFLKDVCCPSIIPNRYVMDGRGVGPHAMRTATPFGHLVLSGE